MRWVGEIFAWNYFGEWSRSTNTPHGRGIWFGENAVRVGYFNNGEIASGKVLRIIKSKEGVVVDLGKEEDFNGKTKFIGRTHFPSGKCESGTWIYDKK